MHYSTKTAVLTSVSLLSCINASPLPQTPDCTANGASPSSLCWNALDMSGYMDTFTKSGYCKLGESWSTCFLRVSGGENGKDCSVLRAIGGNCQRPSMGDYNDLKAYYGAYNIFSTWNYISAWSDAVADIIVKNPQVFKNFSRPEDIAEFSPANNDTDTFNVDVALTNLIHQTNKADPSANAAFVRLLKACPTEVGYSDKASGSVIGNNVQERLTLLWDKISKDLPAFLTLVKGGEFSRTLLYNEDQIRVTFVPSEAVAVSVGNINASSLIGRGECTADSPSALCWKSLDLTAYLNAFTHSGSCKLGENWSNCFLRAVAREDGMDCSDIESQSCKQPTPGTIKDPNAYFAAYNIWSAWSYLKSWSVALEKVAIQDPDVFQTKAQPSATDQFKSQEPVQNIDTALTNLISGLNKADKAANDAFLGLMKADPSVHIYDATKSSGINIANQIQQRFVELMGKISTDLPSFLTLVDQGDFSRPLLYDEQSIENNFLPQSAAGASTEPVTGGTPTTGNAASTTSTNPFADRVVASFGF